ncbi:MAG: hypothetical protein GY710_00265 [Desulfobacteraceae bacterium]|nr:hypothetical protein [Desulfobacteraceae bacterium]
MKKTLYYFHAELVQKILDAVEADNNFIELSLDLNLSSKRFEIRQNCLVLDETLEIDIKELDPVRSSGQKVFVLSCEGLFPIEVRTDAYYKLVPTDTVPTLEIDGIKMHRSKDIDPLVDAGLKTKLVVKPGDQVLDTCGGLGYSAVFALKAGAKKVVSTEKSRGVMQIRCQNPWLMADGFDRIGLGRTDHTHINLINADITQYINELDDSTFDSVIHDPPRFTSATGHLYGKIFYAQLFRVMKPVSRLFHYTGSPKKIQHQDRFIKNAMKRLEEVGFSRVVFNDRLQGIHAVKNSFQNCDRVEPNWKKIFK